MNLVKTLSFLLLITAILSLFSCKKNCQQPQPENTQPHEQTLLDTVKTGCNYFPSQQEWGTLAFDDYWPGKGDEDMNDLVLNYRYVVSSNKNNEVVEMDCDFVIIAAGASFHNGFGVQFPFSAAAVKKVSGQKLVSGYIEFNSDSTEAGQKNAVIIPFDNHEALIRNPDGSYFINTLLNKSKVNSDTAHVVMKFSSKVSASILNDAPFNPFLISNLRRGFEIHLAGHQPTDKADQSLFGTDDDNSNTPSNYYLSKDRLPWAINFLHAFAYPVENANIENTYLHYADWERSGGKSYPDWDTNKSTAYVNAKNVYK